MNKLNELDNILIEFYKIYYKVEEINLNSDIKCLTINELHIIENIGENTWILKDLADKLDITISTASIGISKLVEKNFVKREKAKEDKRQILISLTDKGKLVFKYNDNTQNDTLAYITNNISDKELSSFISTFNKLIKNIKDRKNDISPTSLDNFKINDELKVIDISNNIHKYNIIPKNIIKLNKITKDGVIIEFNKKELLIEHKDTKNIFVIKA